MIFVVHESSQTGAVSGKLHLTLSGRGTVGDKDFSENSPKLAFVKKCVVLWLAIL